MLAPSDLLVVNVSATRAAALTTLEGFRVHISTDAPGGYQVIEVRLPAGAASRPLDEEPPAVLHLAGGGQVEILAPYPDGQGRLWLARLAITESLDTYLVEHGQPIRYPYIAEAWPIEAYQTVFGRLPGSAEMPSAARPFTPDIVTRIVAEGVAVAPLLLHTGVLLPRIRGASLSGAILRARGHGRTGEPPSASRRKGHCRRHHSGEGP